MAGPAVGMNNLTTLIKRLEAATSRLEDIASSAGTFDLPPHGVGNAPTAASTKASASAPEIYGVSPAAPPSLPKPAVAPLPPAISDMDELIAKEVSAFTESAKTIDPLVEKQASAVAKGFKDQRRFLLVSTKAKRPDPQSQTFMDLLKDLQQDVELVGDIRNSNRGSPLKEHLAMLEEGISTLRWLLEPGKPADMVGEMIGGAQMYGNRVLKAHKDKEGDQHHVKFVQSYYALLKALQTYIKKHYPTGVSWNAAGIDAAQAMREVDSTPSTNGSGPHAGGPPPPPPPPLPTFDNVPPPPPAPPGGAPKASSGGDMGAVFEQLNRGSAVTSGLKKVDKSQMTHKNPSLRASSTVPGQESDISRSRSPGPNVKPKPPSMRQNSTASTPKKEPKKELDMNKWLIENFDSPSAPIEIEVSINQSILITNCKKTTIILKGKANAISIDNCPRTQILVESLVSSVDVIKSPNFAIQITGSLPTIMLDQVDGASIYLGPESLRTEVFTSKCSSVNVVLPAESEEDDSKECPVPEQFRTFVKDGRLVHEIVEHAG